MNNLRIKCAVCHGKLSSNLQNSILVDDNNISTEKNVYKIYNIPTNLSCLENVEEYHYDTLSFAICMDCNTIQLDKLIPLNILYKNSHNNTSIGKVWENYFHFFVDNIKNKIINKTILEIGCPSGKIANESKDYDKWYIVEPNKNNNIDFKKNIIFIEKFFDNAFIFDKNVDLIIHSHLFEHIYNPNEFLTKCNELLNENGEMIFGVPNMQYLSNKTLFLGLCFEHTIFLNNENIIYLLNKNGFEVVEIMNFENHSTIYHTRKSNIKINNILKITNYSNIFYKVIDEYKLFIEKCNSTIINNINKDIFIFGASYNTQILLHIGINLDKIKGILDNSIEKQNKYLYGTKLKIYNPEILKNKKNIIVIIRNGYYNEEIILQLNHINNNLIIIE
jgi:predicted SAM-dependent methyltransferase